MHKNASTLPCNTYTQTSESNSRPFCKFAFPSTRSPHWPMFLRTSRLKVCMRRSSYDQQIVILLCSDYNWSCKTFADNFWAGEPIPSEAFVLSPTPSCYGFGQFSLSRSLAENLKTVTVLLRQFVTTLSKSLWKTAREVRVFSLELNPIHASLAYIL